MRRALGHSGNTNAALLGNLNILERPPKSWATGMTGMDNK